MLLLKTCHSVRGIAANHRGREVRVTTVQLSIAGSHRKYPFELTFTPVVNIL